MLFVLILYLKDGTNSLKSILDHRFIRETFHGNFYLEFLPEIWYEEVVEEIIFFVFRIVSDV